jgi:hypothetical protein
MGAAFVYCPVCVTGGEEVNFGTYCVNASGCVSTYSIVWIIFIGIYAASDYLLWAKVIDPYLKEFKETYDANNTKKESTGELTKPVPV